MYTVPVVLAMLAATALAITCPANEYQDTPSTCAYPTNCTGAQFQVTNFTPTTNRVCASPTSCNTAFTYQTANYTTTSDRVCTAYSANQVCLPTISSRM